MSDLSVPDLARLQRQLAVPDLPARYAPHEVIGRGGMGVVWRAHDQVLGRDVAVKVLAEHVDDDHLAARLTREARILARLEHPGIVTVHDAGRTEDGRTWYAMRLIRGRHLDDATESPRTVGDVVRLMTRLGETLAFAHRHGIIHRDLKPANVMVGPFGEVLVLDWGVAGAVATDAMPVPGEPVAAPRAQDDSTTAHGTVLGTPGYMAPEQAAGLPADVRSDIHGLGAILRDLLAAQEGRPHRALLAIRDRALAPAAADRYPDALALVDDLRRFQDGLPVHAHRESPFEVLARWVARYRMPIALVAAYLLMRLLILAWGGL